MSAPKSRRDELRAAANKFHKAHPEVYALFEKYTFELISKGRTHNSADMVFHRIRWDSALGGNGTTEFKLGNNYTPFYARHFIKKHPEHAKFFRLREQKSASKPARATRELTPTDLK